MRRFNALVAGPVIASALILASCATSRQVAGRTDLSPVPEALLQPCNGPVVIEGTETFGEALDGWGQDGANLADCMVRHEAVIEAYRKRDAIQGAKP